MNLLSCVIPRHLLTTDDAEILKNVVLHSVATAFASIVCNIKKVICLIKLTFESEQMHLEHSSGAANHYLLYNYQESIIRLVLWEISSDINYSNNRVLLHISLGSLAPGKHYFYNNTL